MPCLLGESDIENPTLSEPLELRATYPAQHWFPSVGGRYHCVFAGVRWVRVSSRHVTIDTPSREV